MREETRRVVLETSDVSLRLQLPRAARCVLILGHGAGSHRTHPLLEAVAGALLARDVGVFRYNFPYAERGSRRPDPRPVILATVRAMVAEAVRLVGELPVFAGGHSFGGRMTSTAHSEQAMPALRGLVFLSFPLHPADQPSTERAAHLDGVELPMLFVSGTRDRLAQAELLEGVCARLPPATLHWLDTADHGYGVLKRRASDEPVFEEIARVVRGWTDTVLATTE